MYADVERVLIGWLHTQLDVRCLTDTPANLADVLPVVQISRFGGGDDQVTLDRANVDVDVYATGRAAANTLAERVRSALRFELPGTVVDGAVVTNVTTITGPSWRPYENTGIRRSGASFQITVQSHTVKETP